jgi:ADP-heptose:LPS heptosyltransferase
VALSRERVLVLRALGLGDFLTGVPALRGLRRALPGAEVVLAAPVGLAPLVSLSGTVDRLLDTRGPVAPAWTGPPPAIAVDLHGRGPQSHLALAALAPRRLVGFACAEIGHDGPVWIADEHERERWCRLVGEGLGVAADPDDVRLEAPSGTAPVPGAVIVHPGAASPARRWPVDRFAEVARWAAGRGLEVAVTGAAEEADLAGEVARTAGLPSYAVLAGRTDLADLARQVAAARLVVCGDTGMAHLASAFGVPSVVLFGPVPPQEWGPPRAGPHVAVWKGSERGDPHASRVDPALLDISVADVVHHAESVLAACGAQCSAAPAGPSGMVSPRRTGVITGAQDVRAAAAVKSASGDLKTP